MIIQSLGGPAVQIISDKLTLVFEGKDQKANVITASTEADASKVKSTDAHILSWPGEYEVQGASFTGVETENEEVIFLARIEDVNIVHLGKAKDFSSEVLDKIDNTDILILPVGTEFLSVEEAKKLTGKLEPRIILPIGDLSRNFLETMGVSDIQETPKAKISKASLPTDKTEFMLLIQEA